MKTLLQKQLKNALIPTYYSSPSCWKVIEFDTREQMQHWMSTNAYKYIITEIFKKDGFALEYRKIREL